MAPALILPGIGRRRERGMRFEDLNWMDVQSYLQQDDRVMLVLGSCEQHGYLSLLSDLKIPLAIADAAAERSGVLVAPALPFGISPYFMAYPGTISLRPATYRALLEDVVDSLLQAGFRGFLVLNGHGGNEDQRQWLEARLSKVGGARLQWFAWWKSEVLQPLLEAAGLTIEHGNWGEAFPFTRVAPLPEGDKPVVQPRKGWDAAKMRQAIGDGSFGGPYTPPPGLLDKIFDRAVLHVLHLLEALRNGSRRGGTPGQF